MAKRPTNEVVMISWLKTLPGIPVNGVATALPQDNSTWAASGFITVQTISGQPNIYLPERHPVFQLMFWAVNENSQKPPWGKANNLADIVIEQSEPCHHPENFGLVETPVQFDNARVLSGYALTEPVRVLADEARFAVYQMDYQLHWCRAE